MAQPWSKGALPAGHPDAMFTGRYTDRKEWERRHGEVATCGVCGGRYRPAGGPCIHEHPHGMLRQTGPVCCLSCGVSWYPGHTCIAQPTKKEIRELAEMSSVLRLMDEIMEHLADELGVAAPAAWEVM